MSTTKNAVMMGGSYAAISFALNLFTLWRARQLSGEGISYSLFRATLNGTISGLTALVASETFDRMRSRT